MTIARGGIGMLKGATTLMQRLDSWMSIITGLGDVTRDKTTSLLPQFDPVLDWQTCESMFANSDLWARIVSAMPDEALKEGFDLVPADGDADPTDASEEAEAILAEGERLGLQDKLREGMTWGRNYGLGGIVLGCSGAGAPDTELDDEKVTRLDWLMVVDRRELIPATYYTDPASDKFGEVEKYMLQPATMMGAGSTLIHETRIVRFGGVMTSRRERQRNSGCDYSVMQRVFSVLQQTEGNWSSVCQLMSDMSQAVFKINGLTDMIATGVETNMQTRMRMLDMSRSVARAIILDAEHEDFKREPTPMNGVVEVLQQTWQRLAAAAEMPLTVLMGVSPAGLNATGASDIRLWYDKIGKAREHILGPRIVRVVRLISRTLGHATPDTWKVRWPSLWKMSAPEQADMYLKVAQADNLYLTQGVLLPEEVAIGRWASGKDFNSGKISVDRDAREAALKSALDELVNPPEPPSVLLLPPKGGVPPGKAPGMMPAASMSPDNEKGTP